MTKTSPAVNAVLDNDPTARIAPGEQGHGVAALRDKEAKGLISLATDAISEVHAVGHELHSRIYGRQAAAAAGAGEHLQPMLDEAFGCLQTADHYLRMLGDVLAERYPRPDPWSAELAF